MFYCPVVSSSYEINKYKNRIEVGLQEIIKDLEILIYWEKTYNRECMFTEKETSEEFLLKVKEFLS